MVSVCIADVGVVVSAGGDLRMSPNEPNSCKGSGIRRDVSNGNGFEILNLLSILLFLMS